MSLRSVVCSRQYDHAPHEFVSRDFGGPVWCPGSEQLAPTQADRLSTPHVQDEATSPDRREDTPMIARDEDDPPTEERDPLDLVAALDAVIALGDPWRKRVDYCPACEGRGWVLVFKGGGDYHDARQECWDCQGTGEGDPAEEKDITNDD
jgi:hypothetical protein